MFLAVLHIRHALVDFAQRIVDHRQPRQTVTLSISVGSSSSGARELLTRFHNAGKDKGRKVPRKTMRSIRFVVYTCLFGYSERFNDFVFERDDNIDFICFTDDPELRSEFWEIKLIVPELLDPARASKKIKALPHRFLSEYDWSLYVDNTLRLKVPPKRLFRDYLADAESPFVCFHHPVRNCVYDEAVAVLEQSLDDPNRVLDQMQFYRHIGYPAQNGLGTAGFILRRHHDPILVPVMERWHQQVLFHSNRDQLSLNPVMWFDKFIPTYLDGFCNFELFDWPVYNGNRIPRDFDDARYLELNPDVTINPRRHFLHEGEAQGRPYKKPSMPLRGN